MSPIFSYDENTTTFINEFEKLFKEGNYSEAIEAYTKLAPVLSQNFISQELWLKFLCCHVGEDNLDYAIDLLNDYQTKFGQAGLSRLYDLGNAVITSSLSNDETILRGAVERFSQGVGHYQDSGFPLLFTQIEQKILHNSDRLLLPIYNYNVSSYMLWTGGLSLMAEGDYKGAFTKLIESIERYKIGGMEGDVVWSCFDAIVCCLFMEDMDEAKNVYGRFIVGRYERNRFTIMSNLMINAFVENNIEMVHRVNQLLSYGWQGFQDSSYPAILQAFEEFIKGRLNKIDKSIISTEKKVTSDTKTKKTFLQVRDKMKKPNKQLTTKDNNNERKIYFRYLLARPVKDTEEEILTLSKIAKEVNMGNSRPEYIKIHVRASNETLHKDNLVPLEQGVIFFATEFHEFDKGLPQLVGSCKIQHLFDACWIKNRRPRLAHKGEYFSSTDILAYDSKRSNTMEMAGNAVLDEFRGQGIGKFQIQARILYVLIFGIGSYKNLAANLLTVSRDSKYPFYEDVVKPLLGKTHKKNQDDDDSSNTLSLSEEKFIEYDDADHLRYYDAPLLDDLLGKTTNHPVVQFPIHILPEYIKSNFAVVREITTRAQNVLERYGFSKLDKFDLLDAGQYIGTTYHHFRNSCSKYFRSLYLQSFTSMPENASYITFAPSRSTKQNFKAIRVRAVLDGETLSIPEDVRHELEIKVGSEVKVLLDPEAVSK